MSHPVKGVDHCFALVDDLDAAAAQYEALGFTLSPRGTHSAIRGTANYTIMFPNDYFELLGILTPTELNAPRREVLAAKGQGLHAIACRIDTADAAAAALEEIGIATKMLGSFSRPVDLPDGSEGVASFSTVAFTPEETPRGTVFMCEHRSRDTVWVPELLTHANTACGLGAILALSESPEQEAPRFARLWAEGSVSMRDGLSIVHTGPNSAPLILATADQQGAYYEGLDLSGTTRGAFTALRVKVRDLAAVRTCLDAAGIEPVETPAGLAVGPEYAAGVLVEFVTA
ncbi:VOC family protein [Sedimentitalea sp.]|uniref:VOC family protein n=1 Tax=Sedimentitalea sp. TaxID=2048915 RepID=UPI003297E3A4